MKTVVFLFCLAFFASASNAQLTSVGREFYTVFSKQNNREGDTLSLRLYLYGARPATVHVEVPAISFSSTVSVTPGNVTQMNLPPAAEVRAFSMPLPGMAVQITASDDISVVGLNSMQFSSDAFLIYPKNALGNEYTILAWDNSAFTANSSEARSLFAIASTIDSTTVTIIPSASLADGTPANQPVTLLMNKGAALLIGTDPFILGGDLTGTIVKADKPIAVFGGHERAEIPTGFMQIGTNATSRDHLYEQLLPNEAFGDTVVAVLYDEQSIKAPQAIRIIAAEANTTIRLNDSIDLHLPSPGDYYFKDVMTEPLIVTSTKPIIGAQYMHTAPNTQGSGDPSFALLIPTSLYRKNCTFVSIPDPIYTTHAVTIIASSLDGQMSLDGFVLPDVMFKSIPNSTMSYGSVVLTEGLHTLNSDVPVCLTAYGSGEVISYAYSAGFSNEPPMAVDPSTSQAGMKFTALFDLDGKLNIRSRGTARFRATLYDILGRELFRIGEVVQLFGNDTYITNYSPKIRPTYLLIQEYNEHGVALGHPIFLPVP